MKSKRRRNLKIDTVVFKNKIARILFDSMNYEENLRKHLDRYIDIEAL